MNIYIFHRADGFYPLELKDDADAKKNAELNPGTVKVENAITHEIVWSTLDALDENDLLKSLSPFQIDHLSRGLEHNFGCTLKFEGGRLWLRHEESGGALMMQMSRTVERVWKLAQSLSGISTRQSREG